ncbi:MAG: tetratricopeptide repeat protein [Deltaproteobacteria bacterium]|nr:tetratricopeptide repeat protein [Deltaproteobacteria bacterium]
MNGLCTTCQVYFPMPPDFAEGVPYACPQCNALLVPMEEPPAPPPAPEAPAAEAPPAPSPDEISTEEVTLPPQPPLDPPPAPAPPAAPAGAPATASEAPVALTADEDQPESITLVTAIPDEVKAIMAQQAAAAASAASAPATAPAGNGVPPPPAPPAAAAAAPPRPGEVRGPMPDTSLAGVSVVWFHPRVSPEVEAVRARRVAATAPPPPPPAPPPVEEATAGAFSMSGAGGGVAVEDFSGLSIPPAGLAPEGEVDRTAVTVDTPSPAAELPELADAGDFELVSGSTGDGVHVQAGGTRDEIAVAKPRRSPPKAPAEPKPSAPAAAEVRSSASATRPKITTATKAAVEQGGGAGKWIGLGAVVILLGCVIVAFALPQVLPVSLRKALHGDETPAAADPAPEEEPVVEPAPGEGSTPAGAEGEAAEGGDEAAGPAEGEADEAEAAPVEDERAAAEETPETEEPERRAPPRRTERRERVTRTAAGEPARVTRTGSAPAGGTSPQATAEKKPPPPAEPPAEEKAPEAAEDDPVVKAKDHVRAGNSFLKQGKVDQAIRQYEKAILLDGRSAAAHRGLGVAYASLGRAREAVREYELYLKLAPKARDAAQVRQIIDNYYQSQK